MKYLALLVFLIGCGANVNVSNNVSSLSGEKFNVGDCVRTVTIIEDDGDYEFIKPESTTIVLEYKVLAVGKKKYHLQFGRELFTERDISRLNEKGVKINCNELDF